LDDDVWDSVLEKAEKENFNLYEMNKGLELDSYTEQDALYANNVITLMSELIENVINEKIQTLLSIKERFKISAG